MNFKDMFKSKAEKAEANAKAKQMLMDKQEKNKAQAIVMDRMLTQLDMGQLGPYYNRATPAHAESGAMVPKYPTPWSMPKDNFERMVSRGEYDDPSIPLQLMKDYSMLNLDTTKNIDNLIFKTFEMDKIRSAANLPAENEEYWPEEGY